MTRIKLLAVIIAFMLIGTACAPVVVVVTATPPAPTDSAPPPTTPTPEVRPRTGAINDNAEFDTPCSNLYEGTIAGFGGRIQCQPRPFVYAAYFDPAKSAHAWAFPFAGADNGIRMELNSLAGRYGYAVHVATEWRLRYLVKARYSTELTPRPGQSYVPGQLNIVCVYDNLASTRAESPPVQIGFTDANGEALCVFETAQPRTVRVDVLIDNQYGNLNGNFYWWAIVVEEVRRDQYSDAVVALP